jgi:hypothetical protein
METLPTLSPVFSTISADVRGLGDRYKQVQTRPIEGLKFQNPMMSPTASATKDRALARASSAPIR